MKKVNPKCKNEVNSKPLTAVIHKLEIIIKGKYASQKNKVMEIIMSALIHNKYNHYKVLKDTKNEYQLNIQELEII